MNQPFICAALRPSSSNNPRKLGGPRYVCGKPPQHEGDHGEWRLVSQVEHAELSGSAHFEATRVAQFMQELMTLPHLPNVFNPWRDYDAKYDAAETSPDIRHHNLTRYLTERVDKAKLILIGEAPGYRGGKFTGIAMTSERILLGAQSKIPPERVFIGEKQRSSAIDACAAGFIEPTASIVWSLLLNLNIDSREFMLWNAFPCHPHKAGEPLTNRKPLPSELQAAAHVLSALLKLSTKAQLVAVGRVAEGALSALDLPYESVRHPAMGGASAFRAGIKRLLEKP